MGVGFNALVINCCSIGYVFERGNETVCRYMSVYGCHSRGIHGFVSLYARVSDIWSDDADCHVNSCVLDYGKKGQRDDKTKKSSIKKGTGAGYKFSEKDEMSAVSFALQTMLLLVVPTIILLIEVVCSIVEDKFGINKFLEYRWVWISLFLLLWHSFS